MGAYRSEHRQIPRCSAASAGVPAGSGSPAAAEGRQMTPPGQSEPPRGRGTALTEEPPSTATALTSELAGTALDLMMRDPAQPAAALAERLFHASYPGIPE